MSSTNKTTNYELSQFLGTDKPAWLADYNSDMSKIDTGIHTAQTTATGADGKGDSALTKIGNLENLTTSVKTSVVAAINEVDGHADQAQETATNASTTANSASTSVTNLANYFKATYTSTVTASVSGSGSPSVTSQSVKTAYNNGGSFGEISGTIDIAKASNVQSTISISLTDTGFRPASQLTINGGVLVATYDTTYETDRVFTTDLVVNTDGTASISVDTSANEAGMQVNMLPFPLFIA